MRWRRARGVHRLVNDAGEDVATIERTHGGHWIVDDLRNDRTKVWRPGQLDAAKRWAMWAVTGEGREPISTVRPQFVFGGPVGVR